MNNFGNIKLIRKQITNNTLVDDYILYDTTLLYKKENGTYIIAGCSHNGI